MLYEVITMPNLPGVSEEIDMLLDESQNQLDPKAIYVIWAGANDFFLGLEPAGDLKQILPQTITNIADSVCRLSAAGAQHFVV